MKTCLLLALVGLAIGLAVPSFAQEKAAVDPEMRQQIEAAVMKYSKTFNKHDAAAMADLYSLDAIQVWDFEGGGTFLGREAIEKHYAAEFASSPPEHAGNLAQIRRLQSATKCPLSRNVVTGHLRATKHSFMFATPIPGRFAWNTSLQGARTSISRVTEGVFQCLKRQKKMMKTRLLLALVGLAISLVLPSFAQQKDVAGARTAQERDLLGSPNALEVFGDLSGKLDEAYNNKDAEAAAALFTENAVLVTPDGIVFGRQAIKERYAETFQRWRITDFLSRRERLRLNAIDNAVWSIGEWSGSLQTQTGPVLVWGYWSTIYVREGDVWKMRLLSLFDHRAVPPAAETK